ncbi:MAG: tetratricopeptide repeat protein [Anaerolineales bacterium]|nr:tetratricopeptide repeat protein [Anaerolineales bacterium]
MDSQFDRLLMTADHAAQNGDWQQALDRLQSAYEIKPDHPGIINGLGTCLLQLDRPAEAIPWFEAVCKSMPDSPEPASNLGVALVYGGLIEDAELAFRSALEVDAEHRPAWKNLAQILLQKKDGMEEGVKILSALIQSDSSDIESLLLMAGCYEEGGDFTSAAEIYRHILSLQPGLPQASAALQRLEPNPAARDINRIANKEHIQKLASLEVSPQGAPSMRLYAPPGLASAYRLEPAAESMRMAGMRVQTSAQFVPEDAARFDAFFFHDPFQDADFRSAIAACIQAGKRVYLDFPAGLRETAIFGEVPDRGEVLLQKLIPDAVFCTPDPDQALYFADLQAEVRLLPPCWSRSNPFWEKEAQPHPGVHLGIISAYTKSEDMIGLLPALHSVLTEHENSRLALIGAFSDLAALKGIPDDRILLLPLGDIDDFPYLLSQVDILLLPGRERGYSQQAMLAAGIRRIPWIASPQTSACLWKAGGISITAESVWKEQINALINNPGLRSALGEEGFRKACDYEAGQEHNPWRKLAA